MTKLILSVKSSDIEDTTIITQSEADLSIAIAHQPTGNWTEHIFVSLLCLLVSFGGFVYGWDFVISGFVNMDSFKLKFGVWNEELNAPELTSTRVGLMISLFNIGCAVGGIGLSKIGDVKGRKIGLTLAMMIYSIGILIQILAVNWQMYTGGRVVSGLGVGSVSVLSPMFIAETAPHAFRGVLVSCYQLMITLGILLGYCSTYATNNSYLMNEIQWRLPLGLSFIWASMMIFGMTFLPESPRYLLEQDNIDEAKKSIARVNNKVISDPFVLEEIEKISSAIEKEREEGNAIWMELIKGQPHLFSRLIIGIALQSLQQLTGVNYFFYYSTSILKSVGLEDSFLTSIILGAVNFGSTLISLFTVEKLGRRNTLLYGCIIMGICLLTYAIIGTAFLYPHGYNAPSSTNYGIGMIVVTCVFIFAFATTWGPCVFVVISETYPLRIRSKGMAIANAFNWIWGFLISFFTPLITSNLRFAYGFVFFGCVIMAGIFVFLMVPETKGLSLEDIDEMYKNYIPGTAFNTRSKMADLIGGSIGDDESKAMTCDDPFTDVPLP